MVQAYILIQAEAGQASFVAEQIAAIEGVIQADHVTGPYDVVAQLEAASVDHLGRLVVARVQEIAGITRTITCAVVHL